MRILIIEDEEKAGAFLRRGLSEAGFVVDVVATGVRSGFGLLRTATVCNALIGLNPDGISETPPYSAVADSVSA